MPEHEPWCCRSPKSPCAQDDGCSGSCNCGADESIADECREVTLPSGETIRVRSDEPMGPQEAAALGELVDAARRIHGAEHPPNPDAVALWARLDAQLDARGIRLHTAAAEAGVRFSVLMRTAQGILPGPDDLAAVERWLTEPDES